MITVSDLLNYYYSKSWLPRMTKKVLSIGVELDQIVTTPLLSLLGNFLKKLNASISEAYKTHEQATDNHQKRCAFDALQTVLQSINGGTEGNAKSATDDLVAGTNRLQVSSDAVPTGEEQRKNPETTCGGLNNSGLDCREQQTGSTDKRLSCSGTQTLGRPYMRLTGVVEELETILVEGFTKQQENLREGYGNLREGFTKQQENLREGFTKQQENLREGYGNLFKGYGRLFKQIERGEAICESLRRGERFNVGHNNDVHEGARSLDFAGETHETETGEITIKVSAVEVSKTYS